MFVLSILPLFDLRIGVDPVVLDAPPNPARRHAELVNDVLAARGFRARLTRTSTTTTRLLRVARTLADLDLSVTVEPRHVDEAKTMTRDLAA